MFLLFVNFSDSKFLVVSGLLLLSKFYLAVNRVDSSFGESKLSDGSGLSSGLTWERLFGILNFALLVSYFLIKVLNFSKWEAASSDFESSLASFWGGGEGLLLSIGATKNSPYFCLILNYCWMSSIVFLIFMSSPLIYYLTSMIFAFTISFAARSTIFYKAPLCCSYYIYALIICYGFCD